MNLRLLHVILTRPVLYYLSPLASPSRIELSNPYCDKRRHRYDVELINILPPPIALPAGNRSLSIPEYDAARRACADREYIRGKGRVPCYNLDISIFLSWCTGHSASAVRWPRVKGGIGA